DLSFTYVDTGAMFRALAYYFWRHHPPLTPLEEGPALQSALQELHLQYCYDPQKGEMRIFINQEEVTEKIRQHSISDMASQISKNPSIRSFLLQFQRQLAQQGPC